MKSRIKFTKRSLDGLPVPPPGKRKDYYDEQTSNLLVQVTSSGSRTFYLRRKVDGCSGRILIGRYPDLSIEQARGKAAEVKAVIARGYNPQDRRRAARDEAKLGELFHSYMDGHARARCLSHGEIEACFRRYLNDWRERKFTTIRKAEVQARLNQIAADHGVHCANRSLTDMRAAVNWCIKSGIFTGENPWSGLPKFRVSPRDRFIRPDELARFMKVLDSWSNSTFRDYVFVSLLTGARRSNVLAMRWQDIDFNLGFWRIPKTKNGDSQTVPLSTMVLQILSVRHRVKTGLWVFPGRKYQEHYSEPKTSWRRLLRLAGIADLRLHDLRRTLGSYMAIGNSSLHIIGKALGHKSVSATQIYARLSYDPVREAMEKAQADMLALGGIVRGGNSSAVEADDDVIP